MKDRLNQEVSARLRRVGHSNRMIDEAKRDTWWWLEARAQAARRGRGLLEGRGIVFSRQGWAELVPLEVPLAGAGEVTVEVAWSTISPGTERAQYLKLPNATVGGLFKPGYSAAGVVRAVGRGVLGVRVGQPVALRNVPHASLVTTSADRVVPVPAGLELAAAATVTLGMVSAQGVRLAQLEAGEPVTVIGAGPIGVLAQRIAGARGAGPVTLVATSRRREVNARVGGAANFMVAGEDDIDALEAPVVIEATGDPSAIALAVRAAATGGRIVLLGSSRGITRDLPLAELRRKRLTVVGAHVETLTAESERTGRDVKAEVSAQYLDDLASGAVSVRDLHPESVDPREAGALYRRLAGTGFDGGQFRWEILPPVMRATRARLLRMPNVGGRGVDSERAPLKPAGAVSRPWIVDPLASAEGMLRIGLVGCGDIAIHNAAAVAEAPNTVVTACFDPVQSLAEGLAASHGAVASASLDELLARDDVDVAVLSVPHHLHAPLAIRAAEAGRHVVVEKPPANNMGEAVRMVRAAEEAGVQLSFCFPQRYDAAAAATKRLIEAGAIGRFTGATVRLLQDRSPSYWLGGFSGRSHSDWRSSRQRAGGGTLIMNLCHYIDLLRWLVGDEVERVTAIADAVDHPGEVEDTVSVAAHFRSGAVASFFGSTAVRGTLSSEVRIWGRDGHIVVEPEPLLFSHLAVDGLLPSRWQTFGELPAVNMRAGYFSRLGTSLARGEAPEITPGDGLAVQALIEAAYRSAAEGRTVALDEVFAELPAPV